MADRGVGWHPVAVRCNNPFTKAEMREILPLLGEHISFREMRLTWRQLNRAAFDWKAQAAAGTGPTPAAVSEEAEAVAKCMRNLLNAMGALKENEYNLDNFVYPVFYKAGLSGCQSEDFAWSLYFKWLAVSEVSGQTIPTKRTAGGRIKTGDQGGRPKAARDIYISCCNAIYSHFHGPYKVLDRPRVEFLSQCLRHIGVQYGRGWVSEALSTGEMS